jgi:hypothetical protein
MKILAIYYSQSGQIKDILNSITKPLIEKGAQVDFVNIQPDPVYPFPWTSNEFFAAFPYSKLGMNCALKQPDINYSVHYDLIIMGLQVWYLEPSIPMASLLRSEYANIFANKPVITVYGVRNMWVNAHRNMKQLIKNAGGKLVGNIVLQDPHNNLVSVLTIIRWLIKGNKQAGKLLPAAGIPEKDILSSEKFGELIWNDNTSGYQNLHSQFLENNAFKVDYHLMKTEFAGTRIFGIWAKLIQKNSTAGSKKRTRLLIIFKYYLFFVIFVVSPISSLIFRFIRLVFRKRTEQTILQQTSLND